MGLPNCCCAQEVDCSPVTHSAEAIIGGYLPSAACGCRMFADCVVYWPGDGGSRLPWQYKLEGRFEHGRGAFSYATPRMKLTVLQGPLYALNFGEGLGTFVDTCSVESFIRTYAGGVTYTYTNRISVADAIAAAQVLIGQIDISTIPTGLLNIGHRWANGSIIQEPVFYGDRLCGFYTNTTPRLMGAAGHYARVGRDTIPETFPGGPPSQPPQPGLQIYIICTRWESKIFFPGAHCVYKGDYTPSVTEACAIVGQDERPACLTHTRQNLPTGATEIITPDDTTNHWKTAGCAAGNCLNP